VALAEAKAALAIAPTSAEAKSLADAAERERGQQKIYEQVTRAFAAKRYERTITEFAKIAEDSVYKGKAIEAQSAAIAEYVRIQRDAGKKLADRGRCREQRKLAATAEGVVGPPGRDAVLAFPCSDAGAAPRPPDPTPTGPTADDLLAEAKAAAKSERFGKALSLCQSVLVKRPSDADAAQICVIAACNLKSAATAQKYLDKIKSESRVGTLKQVCFNKGVTLE
jgi:hypothetical protein